ncbi:lipopolysaccharide biosynthesis protein [Vibrio fluvialis]|uniref:lipopolysaccharide biosynthesis protein n=1 Tax=Vibrio fluvialis TaxID=676 RepID=UPI002573DD9E|nr:lipopolysaccharide biosynthesis protein [Vibrio fluvialis]BEI22387.1 O7 family O-antigen flippase [Vibrio fluvialis]
MQHSKRQIKSGFLWSAIDSFGNQALGLAISLILANRLGPSAYGLIAMLTIFIAISGVFVNSGFSSALIRKVDRNESDFSTTFYFSLLMSLVCYLILFLASPYISLFYGQPELKLLTKVIALAIVVDTLAIIPRTKLSVSLDFKSQAKANFFALFISGGVALYMAFNNLGVWALVSQHLIRSIVNAVTLNVIAPWKPSEAFCKKSFKELFGFGSKLLASSLLDTIYKNIYGLIIGKQFSSAQLGIYNQANTLSSMPATIMTGIVQRVTYPMLSEIQNDKEKLDSAYIFTLQVSALVIFPILLGLNIVSEPLIALILGDKWQESASLMSILTFGMVLYPVHAINLNLLQVKGRSDLFLKLEVIKKIIITVVLFITVPMGVTEMCIGVVVTSFLALLINTYYTGKLSSITQCKQIEALVPTAIIASLSAFVGYVLGDSIDTDFLRIIFSLLPALAMYLLLMTFFQRPLMHRVYLMLF